jgi:hypothetical protein
MTCRRVFWTYTFLESLCFGTDGRLLCFHWFILKKKTVLIKKLTLKIYSAASTGSHGKYMIVWGLYRHYTEGQITGSRKLSRHPGFSYVPQILPFLLKREGDDLRSKSRLPWQSIRPKGRRFIVLKCIYYRLFLSLRHLYVQYSPASSFDNVQIENAHKMIDNIKHCISISTLKFHIHKSSLVKYFVVFKRELFTCVKLILVRELTLFWVIRQRVVVISYRRFATT